jgi:hypothetical protein
MRKYFILSVLLVAGILCSCEPKQPSNVVFEILVAFKVQSASGVDLLNPANPEAINIDAIEIYHVMADSSVILEYESGLDARDGFSIISPSASASEFYLFDLALLPIGNNVGYIPTLADDATRVEQHTLYIKWNENDTDTVYATFKHNGSVHTYDKVWYNENLITQLARDTIPIIVK